MPLAVGIGRPALDVGLLYEVGVAAEEVAAMDPRIVAALVTFACSIVGVVRDYFLKLASR